MQRTQSGKVLDSGTNQDKGKLDVKLTRKNIHCFRFTVASNLNGFGAGSNVGRMLGKRLKMYPERDIFAPEINKSSDIWLDEQSGVCLQ